MRPDVLGPRDKMEDAVALVVVPGRPAPGLGVQTVPVAPQAETRGVARLRRPRRPAVPHTTLAPPGAGPAMRPVAGLRPRTPVFVVGTPDVLPVVASAVGLATPRGPAAPVRGVVGVVAGTPTARPDLRPRVVRPLVAVRPTVACVLGARVPVTTRDGLAVGHSPQGPRDRPAARPRPLRGAVALGRDTRPGTTAPVGGLVLVLLGPTTTRAGLGRGRPSRLSEGPPPVVVGPVTPRAPRLEVALDVVLALVRPGRPCRRPDTEEPVTDAGPRRVGVGTAVPVPGRPVAVPVGTQEDTPVVGAPTPA